MSPILVRPFREQYEHDRVIRLLQARFRRRYDVAVNVGDTKTAPVRMGSTVVFPDLVLTSLERSRQVQGVVEVETGESVNNLEAMAEWARFAQIRGAFFLYVPAGSADIARRLCEENRVTASEIWSYHSVGDQIRFTLIFKAPVAARPGRRAAGPRKRTAAAASRKAGSRSATTRGRSRASGRAARAQKRK